MGQKASSFWPGDEWPFRPAPSVEECYVIKTYVHEGHDVHLVVYRVIWCPERRQKMLAEPVRDCLEQTLNEVVAENS